MSQEGKSYACLGFFFFFSALKIFLLVYSFIFIGVQLVLVVLLVAKSCPTLAIPWTM